MQTQDLQNILRTILTKLQNKKFTWRLEGSANLKIQGIPTTINDLDITTNYQGIEIFRQALKQYITKDSFNEKINEHQIICDINNIEVEINSYGDREKNMFDKTKEISWNNLQIPILPLKYAKKFYKAINRTEKVKLIENHLK